MNQTEYRVHGVRVERFMPLTPVQGPRPIVFVHGGCHGSWSWVHFLPYFAQAGWDCHALNWFGHNGSAPHPEVGLLQRGIADVTEEIAHVAGQFEDSPVIVAHSMGALAAQKYAECHPVSALVLLTPVVPTEWVATSSIYRSTRISPGCPHHSRSHATYGSRAWKKTKPERISRNYVRSHRRPCTKQHDGRCPSTALKFRVLFWSCRVNWIILRRPQSDDPWQRSTGLITAICAAVVTTFFWSRTGERRRAWLRLGWPAKPESVRHRLYVVGSHEM